MFVANIDQIKSRHATGREFQACSDYKTVRANDLKRIKDILTYDSTPQIYYGKGWVRINGISFNGFRKEHIEKIMKENNINTCKLANNVL